MVSQFVDSIIKYGLLATKLLREIKRDIDPAPFLWFCFTGVAALLAVAFTVSLLHWNYGPDVAERYWLVIKEFYVGASLFGTAMATLEFRPVVNK